MLTTYAQPVCLQGYEVLDTSWQVASELEMQKRFILKEDEPDELVQPILAARAVPKGVAESVMQLQVSLEAADDVLGVAYIILAYQVIINGESYFYDFYNCGKSVGLNLYPGDSGQLHDHFIDFHGGELSTNVFLRVWAKRNKRSR